MDEPVQGSADWYSNLGMKPTNFIDPMGLTAESPPSDMGVDHVNPYKNRYVTHPFGSMEDPFAEISTDYEHLGTDIRADPDNTPALISGTVRVAGWQDDGSGNLVQVKNDIEGQNFYSNTMHNSITERF